MPFTELAFIWAKNTNEKKITQLRMELAKKLIELNKRGYRIEFSPDIYYERITINVTNGKKGTWFQFSVPVAEQSHFGEEKFLVMIFEKIEIKLQGL